MCRPHPTQWWFGGGHRETMLAKDICSGCVVRTSCLEFALSRPELLGVWAATTPTERAAMRRAARALAAAVRNDTEPEGRDDAGADAPAERVPTLTLAPDPEERDPEEPEVEPEHDPAGARDSGDAAEPESRRELLTPAEAARLLGVKPNTVTRWARAGKVSAIQTMGGHRRFRRSEVERLLRDANRRGDTARH